MAFYMFKYWPLVYRAEPMYFFSDFSTKTYDVGTLNNRFNETVLLSTKTHVKSDG